MDFGFPRVRPGWALALLAPFLAAQNLAEFEKKVGEFTLANGMHFIVIERHQAPVVSFHAHVNAGSVNDPAGQTGLAHMFEHMIGKGTEVIGGHNPEAERKALAEVEDALDAWEAEKRKGDQALPKVAAKLEAQYELAVRAAGIWVVPNQYPALIELNGGVGFNASTAPDFTTYHYSLPSNRIELWFLLQSEWFRRPVFREFYKERDVVLEERRSNIDSSPAGRLEETLLATAFSAHPYRAVTGWASDIGGLRVPGAEQFHRTYYAPGNITIAIAGDIRLADAKRLADKYFAAIPAGPLPKAPATTEPEQEGERRVAIASTSQPILTVSYKRPDQRHADDPVFDVLAVLLAGGRTGLLYKDLVRDQKLAVDVDVDPAFPGCKYPCLFQVTVVPAVGHRIEENEKALLERIEVIRNEKVDDAALARVKTKVRASVIHQLDGNAGLAAQLAFYHVHYGNWRILFTGLNRINQVSAEDVERVASRYLGARSRTVAHTAPPGDPSVAAAPPSPAQVKPAAAEVKPAAQAKRTAKAGPPPKTKPKPAPTRRRRRR